MYRGALFMSKDRQVNFRLNEETQQKLIAMSKEAGVSKSKILIDLIMKGEVNTHFGQRDTIERVSAIEDSMNKNDLAFKHDIQIVSNNIERLIGVANGECASIIKQVAYSAIETIERINENHKNNKTQAEEELLKYVNS